MSIELHIISFDVPYPADYGGVIEVYGKLKALKQLGVKVALHCFEYGRGESQQLKEVAEEVYYYSRKKSFVNQLSSKPYIVKGRENYQLLERLLADNAPILFEGLHTTSLLPHPKLKDRIKWVRMHNVEHHYYRSLSNYDQSWVEKLYYQIESRKLKLYQEVLRYANGIFAISPSDQEYFETKRFNSHYLPVFHGFKVIQSTANTKGYALYHGNLSVAENCKAVEFLIDVFESLDFQLVIAGRMPEEDLRLKVQSQSNVKLVENPTESELDALISEAKVNCLPTFQNTGVKLKLIRSLLQGNLVLANQEMVEGSGLENYVTIANSKESWQKKLLELMELEVDSVQLNQRKDKLAKEYDGLKNAQQMMEWLVPAR